MADIDIDPFEGEGREHDRTEEPMDEHIPLSPVTPVGGSIWEPKCEQETSFEGSSVLYKEYLVGKIYELIGNKTHQRLEPNLDLFKLGEDGRLYYKGNPLMNRNRQLKMVGVIADTLGINGLREIGYNISKTNLKPPFVLERISACFSNKSISDIARADDIELQEIVKSMEDLVFQINNQSQMDDLFKYPLRDLLGLDKQLRSIRGLLKVEVAKKVQLEENIKKEHCKLKEFREYPGVYGNDQLEEIKNRIERLNKDLKIRQESIDLLKRRLKN